VVLAFSQQGHEEGSVYIKATETSLSMKQLRAKVKPLLRGLKIDPGSDMFQKQGTETCDTKKPAAKQSKASGPVESKQLHEEVEARLRELGGVYSERWVPLLLRASAAEAEAVARMAEGQAVMAKRQEAVEEAEEVEEKATKQAKKQAKKEAKKAAKKEAEEKAKKEAEEKAKKAEEKAKKAEEKAKKAEEKAKKETEEKAKAREDEPIYPFGDGGWSTDASATMAVLLIDCTLYTLYHHGGTINRLYTIYTIPPWRYY
jgi:hypothetical protein